LLPDLSSRLLLSDLEFTYLIAFSTHPSDLIWRFDHERVPDFFNKKFLLGLFCMLWVSAAGFHDDEDMCTNGKHESQQNNSWT
jgi:hypothetical protein